jgi:hypothetical protein
MPSGLAAAHIQILGEIKLDNTLALAKPFPTSYRHKDRVHDWNTCCNPATSTGAKRQQRPGTVLF